MNLPLDDQRLRVLVAAAAITVIIAGLRAAAGVLDPILLSAVVVACAAPLDRGLRRRGLRPWLVTTVTVSVMVLGVLAFGGIVGYAAKALVETVPQYQDRLTALLDGAARWLDARGIDASRSQLRELLSPARLISLSTQVLSRVGSAVSVTLLILLLSIFLLIESSAFLARRARRSADVAVPGPWAARLEAAAADVQQYVWLTLLTGGMYALVAYALFLLMGVDLALLWAILALLLNFIPGVGFFISVVPPVLLTLLEFGPVRALLLVAILAVVNNISDNVVKPRFMQQGFDLGPFVLFASMLFWAYVLGPTGALLAVPLTTAARRLFLDNQPA